MRGCVRASMSACVCKFVRKCACKSVCDGVVSNLISESGMRRFV